MFHPDIAPMPLEIRAQLAPSGVLRAGINLSNGLLVTGRAADGSPQGVSPDMARAIAENLGLSLHYVLYESPGALADAALRGEWDIGLIGAEPQRAETIAFTPAYAQIEAGYLVPPGSPIASLGEVDRAGVRIAVFGRAAYGLWLDRNIRHAELIRFGSMEEAAQNFRDRKLDVLASLRQRLKSDAAAMPGSCLLPGFFMAVQQAVGVPAPKAAAVEWLARFVAAARAQGFVAELIARHRVEGLAVA